jgi:hypothetical protein
MNASARSTSLGERASYFVASTVIVCSGLCCASVQTAADCTTFEAVSICQAVSALPASSSSHFTIAGVYFHEIHGSILTSTQCPHVICNLRYAESWREDRRTGQALRAKNPDNHPIQVVMQGTLRNADMGQCFGAGCHTCELEVSRVMCSAQVEGR